MDKGDSHCALASRGRHAFDRACSDVANGEGARDRCLQIIRRASDRPERRRLALLQKVRARDDVAAGIPDDLSVRCPFGVRNTADRHEKPVSVDPLTDLRPP